MIDLRSDTVTKPTPGMLEAMISAKVGDDVFGEDETTNALEQKAAALFEKEAAIFCPSGTMTNQIAVNLYTTPGDEIICDKLSHVYHYEAAGLHVHSGVSVHLISGDKGRFTAQDVYDGIRDFDDIHTPNTSMVVVENTCNKGGGSIWNFDELIEIRNLCEDAGMAFHLDGARLFNAMVETDEEPFMYGRLFNSISICLSKGLGAPAGSLLLGDKDFVLEARRVRKRFGGAMRQAGYITAAGIYALDNHVERLKEDHVRAKKISAALEGKSYVKNIYPVETNIVIFDLRDDLTASEFLSKLESYGVLGIAFGPSTVRLVTHLDFNDNDLEKVEDVLTKLNL